jgi:NTP pyrophosphatase (non-canonical NTP hydrolase)
MSITTLDPPLTLTVLDDVIAERNRQDRKWGQQRHDMTVWMTVIGEEFGEVCQVILKARPNPDWQIDGSRDHLRAELVQLAAVTIAAIEAMDDGRSVPGKGVPA